MLGEFPPSPQKIINCLFTVRGPVVRYSLKGRPTYFPPCSQRRVHSRHSENICRRRHLTQRRKCQWCSFRQRGWGLLAASAKGMLTSGSLRTPRLPSAPLTPGLPHRKCPLPGRRLGKAGGGLGRCGPRGPSPGLPPPPPASRSARRPSSRRCPCGPGLGHGPGELRLPPSLGPFSSVTGARHRTASPGPSGLVSGPG